VPLAVELSLKRHRFGLFAARFYLLRLLFRRFLCRSSSLFLYLFISVSFFLKVNATSSCLWNLLWEFT
jgi:hypothetical protein